MAIQHATELKFALEMTDGWPPISIECLPFSLEPAGLRLLAAPIFVKDLSVGDIISATSDENGNVTSWRHQMKSSRTTIWLLRMTDSEVLPVVLSELRQLGCNTAQLPNLGCFLIDVPAELAIADVDRCLEKLDPDAVAIAYPSFRHPE